MNPEIVKVLQNYAMEIPSTCAMPGCPEKPIKSHTIQRSRYLVPLANAAGKVWRIHPESLGKLFCVPGTKSFRSEKVPTTKSITSPLLCAAHDTKLFSEIENDAPNFGRFHDLFLLAYRSVIREGYARERLDKAINESFTDLLRKKLITPEFYDTTKTARIGTAAGNYFFQPIVRKFHRWAKYPNFIKRIEWSSIVIELPDAKPLLAVESLFELCRDNPQDQKYLIMQVLPTDGRQVLFFFFRRRHAKIVHDYLQLRLGKEFPAKVSLRKLSTLILLRSEMFCLNPDHYDSFPAVKKELIENLFAENTDMYVWKADRETNLWEKD